MKSVGPHLLLPTVAWLGTARAIASAPGSALRLSLPLQLVRTNDRQVFGGKSLLELSVSAQSGTKWPGSPPENLVEAHSVESSGWLWSLDRPSATTWKINFTVFLLPNLKSSTVQILQQQPLCVGPPANTNNLLLPKNSCQHLKIYPFLREKPGQLSEARGRTASGTKLISPDVHAVPRGESNHHIPTNCANPEGELRARKLQCKTWCRASRQGVAIFISHKLIIFNW